MKTTQRRASSTSPVRHCGLFASPAVGADYGLVGDFVPCPVSGNLQFKNKEGTSTSPRLSEVLSGWLTRDVSAGAYYFALQVRNSVLPIDKLEVSTNGGASWTAVERAEYNYFTSYSYVLVSFYAAASRGRVLMGPCRTVAGSERRWTSV